jgi:hypothetical protein
VCTDCEYVCEPNCQRNRLIDEFGADARRVSNELWFDGDTEPQWAVFHAERGSERFRKYGFYLVEFVAASDGIDRHDG